MTRVMVKQARDMSSLSGAAGASAPHLQVRVKIVDLVKEVVPFGFGSQQFGEHVLGHTEIAIDAAVVELQFQDRALWIVAGGSKHAGLDWLSLHGSPPSSG